jgi:urea transporter
MCFSAEASFTGSAVISAIGVTTLAKIRKPAQILFGAIPLLFGIQQCAEGVLWVTLKSGSHERLENTATYIFLVTALVIWPTMIPLSIRFMEKVRRRKKVLAYLTGLGGALSLFYAICLIVYNVTPQIQSFHIDYVDEFPGTLVKIAFACYLVTTIAPIFISSVKRMWLFGTMIAISCLITGIFFAQYLTSVWCFFAAIISIVIYWILRGTRREAEELAAGLQS